MGSSLEPEKSISNFNADSTTDINNFSSTEDDSANTMTRVTISSEEIKNNKLSNQTTASTMSYRNTRHGDNETTFPSDMLAFPELNDPDLIPPLHHPRYTPHLANISLALKSQNVSQFDYAFTAPSCGYQYLLHLYQSGASCFAIPQIPASFPLLVLTSQDDSFVTPTHFPYAQAASNPAIIIAECVKGGHVGFVEALNPKASSWAERVALEYARALCKLNNIPPPQPKTQPDSRIQQEHFRSASVSSKPSPIN
eukprot:c9854_g1_i2.p1 GENE.c9854_g1_i2~~c9854_g1_i2.p1  ORF type:complete len:254 (-),score=51.14 c9854_g1_i2:179-940(-)